MSNESFKRDAMQQGREKINTSAELKSKFFFHWSLLSGATLTVLFPFIQKLAQKEGPLILGHLLKWSIILLMISLVTSSLRNLIASRGFWVVGKLNSTFSPSPKAHEEVIETLTSLSRFQKIIEWTSILTYIAALILIYLFTWPNLDLK